MNGLARMTPQEWQTVAAWVAAGATVLGVVCGLFSIRWQIRRQWLLNSANLVTSLVEKFGADDMLKQRYDLARLVDDHVRGLTVDISGDVPLLSFFENIGHLVRRNALDKKMVFNKFTWWVVRYYWGLTEPTDLIAALRRQEHDPTLYEEFVWLGRELVEVYRRDYGVSVHDPALRAEWVAQLVRSETKYGPVPRHPFPGGSGTAVP